MICVSLAEPSLKTTLKALEGLPMAEIRMDITPLQPAEIKRLFASPLTLIATFRPGSRKDSERLSALATALGAGAAFVDIESDAQPAYREKLIRIAGKHNCRVILSLHSPGRPPARDRLLRIRDGCFRKGADIVKIVYKAQSTGDCVRLLSLYDTPRANRVVALGTGTQGAVTRVAAPLLGAPFTYAALRPGRETAEGQPDWKTLDRILSLISDD